MYYSKFQIQNSKFNIMFSRFKLLLIIFLVIFGAQFFASPILKVARAQTIGTNTIQAAGCPPPLINPSNLKKLEPTPDSGAELICQGYDCYTDPKASRCWTDYGIFSGDPKVSPVSPNCLACGSCDICDLASGVSGIIYWIMLLIGVTALLVVIWGGAQYLFSGGIPARAKKGADILKYAGLGIVIILFAYTAVAYLLYALTGGDKTPTGKTVDGAGFLNSWLSPCASRKDRFTGGNLSHIARIDELIACYKYERLNSANNLPAGDVYKFCPPPANGGNGGCGFTVNMFDLKATYTDSTYQPGDKTEKGKTTTTGKPSETPPATTPPTTK